MLEAIRALAAPDPGEWLGFVAQAIVIAAKLPPAARANLAHDLLGLALAAAEKQRDVQGREDGNEAA